MFYTSTRDRSVRVTSAQAITRGISADGGLFVPEEIPQISAAFLQELSELDYLSRAKKVLALYLTDFSEEETEQLYRLYAKLYAGMERVEKYAEEIDQ